MKESHLDYSYEYLDPKSDWIFITPSMESDRLWVKMQEAGNLIINGKHHTERGPLESFQIAWQKTEVAGTIDLDGKQYSFSKENEILFLDCRNGYRIDTFGYHEGTFVHFWSEELAHYMDLFKELNNGDPVLHSSSHLINTNLNKLLWMYKHPNDFHSDLMAETLVVQMVLELIQLANPNRRGNYSEYVQAAIDIINEHYAENITLDTLSEMVHISKFYLSHVFRNETGITPISYLQQVRINRAKELLRTTDLSQEAICSRIGLYNCSYLSKLFRAYEDLTPKQYRQKWR